MIHYTETLFEPIETTFALTPVNAFKVDARPVNVLLESLIVIV